jgi:fatty-acyl-CoA synthase
LPGSARVEIVRCDWKTRKPHRDELGRLELASPNEPGLLVVRLDADDVTDRGLIEGAFVDGDRWGLTGDVLRFDDDGDYRFIDSLSGFVETPGGPVSLRAVEDALYTLPGVEMAAAYAEGARIIGVVVADERPPQVRCDEAFEALPVHGRPAELRLVAKIPMTEGYRPDRAKLHGVR